jgi:hypothetical protein
LSASETRVDRASGLVPVVGPCSDPAPTRVSLALNPGY